jgi:rubrerythrin
LSKEELRHVAEIEKKYHLHFNKDYTHIDNLDSGLIMGVKINPAEITSMLLLEKALEIEKNAQNFYEEQANNSQVEKIRVLYRQLAAEEKEHYYLIKSFIDKEAIY